MIVDFHTHIFPPEIIARRAEFLEQDAFFEELYGHPRAKMATAEDLLASMEADGVDVSVTFPFGWRDQGLIEECNSYVLQAMRDHPGRIVGLAGDTAAGRGARRRRDGAMRPRGDARHRRVDATRPGLPAERHTSAHAAGGGGAGAGPLRLDAYERAGGPPYRGKGDVTPAELQAFIAAFPTLRIVAAHWGGGYPFYELMPEVHAAATNVWYDSAASLYLYRPEIFGEVARIAGPQKILWGSDFPLLGQRRMLDYARSSGLDDEALSLALGENARALLGASVP